MKSSNRRRFLAKGMAASAGAVAYGNLLFIAGVGAHFEGDIKAHTKFVLDSIQKQIEAAGSSMDKHFGPEPPVRTTIAAAGGVPGNSLVEIDVIACI
jgi:2-iminobutanoate/2-iminopropanoate deaminase